MNKKVFKVILLALAVYNTPLFAQTAAKEPHSDTYVYLILGALLFTLAVMFASLMIFEVGERKPKTVKVKHLINAPIIEDHDYDGIHELDNPAPAWFQFLFYLTIIFAIIYMINYHLVGKQNSSIDEYLQEVTVAQPQKILPKMAVNRTTKTTRVINPSAKM